MTISAAEFHPPFPAACSATRLSAHPLLRLAGQLPPGNLAVCRQRLSAPRADLLPVRADYRDFYAALTGRNLRLCPECGIGTMVRMELPPVSLWLDSS